MKTSYCITRKHSTEHQQAETFVFVDNIPSKAKAQKIIKETIQSIRAMATTSTTDTSVFFFNGADSTVPSDPKFDLAYVEVLLSNGTVTEIEFTIREMAGNLSLPIFPEADDSFAPSVPSKPSFYTLTSADGEFIHKQTTTLKALRKFIRSQGLSIRNPEQIQKVTESFYKLIK